MRSLSKLLIVGAVALGAASMKTASLGILKAGPAMLSGATAGRVARVAVGRTLLEQSRGDPASESDPASEPVSPALIQAFLAKASQPPALPRFDSSPQLPVGESDAERSWRLVRDAEIDHQQMQQMQIQMQQAQMRQLQLQQLQMQQMQAQQYQLQQLR